MNLPFSQGVDLVDESLVVRRFDQYEIVLSLNPGVIHDATRLGKHRRQVPRSSPDGSSINHGEDHVSHPQARLTHGLPRGFLSAAHDNLPSQLVQSNGQPRPMPELPLVTNSCAGVRSHGLCTFRVEDLKDRKSQIALYEQLCEVSSRITTRDSRERNGISSEVPGRHAAHQAFHFRARSRILVRESFPCWGFGATTAPAAAPRARCSC